MDQGTEIARTTRWLAWVVACVMLVGLVVAGIRVAAGDSPGSAVVTAAGGRSSAVDVTSTITVPITIPAASATTTTLRTTTTLSPAAVAVLRAIASTTTTTRPPAPTTTTSTTRPPAPTTTTRPTPTTAPAPTTTVAPTTTSTSTTVPATFSLTIVNEHPQALTVTVNGREFPLPVGQTVPATVLPVAPGGDVVLVRAVSDADCGSTDNGALFVAGASYRINVVAATVMCDDFARPSVNITRL